jgi:hypothetical protein
MAMVPQSPKSISPYALAINEPTIPMEAAAIEPSPVPTPELAIREMGQLIPCKHGTRHALGAPAPHQGLQECQGADLGVHVVVHQRCHR